MAAPANCRNLEDAGGWQNAGVVCKLGLNSHAKKHPGNRIKIYYTYTHAHMCMYYGKVSVLTTIQNTCVE